MHAIDLAIVGVSLAALLALGGWLAARQRVTSEYYLGGRKLPAWALGLSLAANQASAISLIGAPAFVALREGGGLGWLQYELAVPLAMAVLVVWGVTRLRSAPGADVYAGVEARLGPAARRVLALLFLLGRGAGAGVILYASSLLVASVTGWGMGTSLVLMGVVALAYTALGGLVADVVTDVAQLVLLWGGTAVVAVLVAVRLADHGPILDGIDPARLVALDLGGHGLGDGASFALWPMLLGGFFLYLSYYGCDQTQAQRLLAAGSERDARVALTTAALVRVPLVATYCLLGVLLARLLVVDPAFAARLAGKPADALVPELIAYWLPVGVRGVAVAAILAAALSSVDSALNSLSAVTIEELEWSEGRWAIWRARAVTVVWGVLTVVAGLAFSRAGETTIELVNRVGSAIYGPILAVFVLAWWARRASGVSAVAGALAGLAANLALAWLAPDVSWLWWNLWGFGIALMVGVTFGRRLVPTREFEAKGRGQAWLLLVTFGIILAALALIGAR